MAGWCWPTTRLRPTSAAFLAAVFLLGSPPPVSAADTLATARIQPAPLIPVRVVTTYPHDAAAFTQGLVFADNRLFESTGLYGESSLRELNLERGTVRQIRRLPDSIFGEGITVFGDRLLQLTWRARIGFIYELAGLKRVGEFRYATEGWGLTHDGRRLILSDGSARLQFLNPVDFSPMGTVDVRNGSAPVQGLNELEFFDGQILANVWRTDRIARIDPASGRVTGWLDLTGLLSARERAAGAGVLNGIAYDAGNRRLFVTGKRWPKIFQIALEEGPRPNP